MNRDDTRQSRINEVARRKMFHPFGDRFALQHILDKEQTQRRIEEQQRRRSL
jgi:hypothetical protein